MVGPGHWSYVLDENRRAYFRDPPCARTNLGDEIVLCAVTQRPEEIGSPDGVNRERFVKL